MQHGNHASTKREAAEGDFLHPHQPAVTRRPTQLQMRATLGAARAYAQQSLEGKTHDALQLPCAAHHPDEVATPKNQIEPASFSKAPGTNSITDAK